MTDTSGPNVWRRVGAAVVLVFVLAGLLVWAGTLSPADAPRDVPDEDEIGPEPEAYVGERVTLSGTVVGTDPVVIDIEYGTGETFTVTVDGIDNPVAAGDVVTASGRLEDSSTLTAERVIVREPWELWYMYSVSFLAGLWMLGRTLRRWRFDTDVLAFVPRERPLGPGGERDA